MPEDDVCDSDELDELDGLELLEEGDDEDDDELSEQSLGICTGMGAVSGAHPQGCQYIAMYSTRMQPDSPENTASGDVCSSSVQNPRPRQRLRVPGSR